MSSVIYNACIDNLSKGNIDFDTDTFKVLLVTAAYVPNRDTHDYRDDVTNEVTGTGYTAGGKTVAVTVTKDNVTDRVDVTLGGASWTLATITARGAVYYKSRGGAASADELVAYINFGYDVSSIDGTFTLSSSTLRFQMGALVINEDGEDVDTRIEGDTDENLIFVDAGTDRVGIGTNAPGTKLDVNGTFTARQGAIINDAGANSDFRVEGTTDVNALLVDADQNAVGIGVSAVNTSAKLEIASTTRGVLVPRLTNGQRNAIVSPATGLMVYNLSTGTFDYYSGSAWLSISTGGGGGASDPDLRVLKWSHFS